MQIRARDGYFRRARCARWPAVATALMLISSAATAQPYGDVFSSGRYGGGNTTGRTGKGATQDNSVYCQQTPDGRVIPQPYGGTRRNIPCGPNFAPQPSAPPPPVADTAMCPMRTSRQDYFDPAALRLSAAVAYASDSISSVQVAYGRFDNGLFVAGKSVLFESEAGLPPLTGVQKEIFRAMSCNYSRRFEFASTKELKDNLRVRESIVRVMDEVRLQRLKVVFTGSDFRLPPATWEKNDKNPEASITVITRHRNPDGKITETSKPLSWQTRSGTSASTAIAAFLKPRKAADDSQNDPDFSALECLGGMEMVVLSGIYRGLGAAQFDRLHPAGGDSNSGSALYGIGVPVVKDGVPSLVPTSVTKNLYPVRSETPAKPQGPIVVADMVPGDYVYLSNVSDYAQLHDGRGDWAGENSIYMGQGEFYGFGLVDSDGNLELNRVTEKKLSTALLTAYNNQLPYYRKSSPGRMSQIRWTLLSSPVVSGNAVNAGYYVR